MSLLFMKILNMSLAAGYCIAAVIILRLLFRKQPKIFSYLLWSVVLFRLICPFSISSSFSLLRFDTEMISQENIMRWSGGENENGWGNTGEDDMQEQHGADEIQQQRMLSTGSERTKTAFWIQRVITAAAWVWFGGMLLLTGAGIRKAVRLARSLKRAVRMDDRCYEMEGIDTPFVFGLIRPRIYLPVHLTEKDKRYVLEHEGVHIARKDHLVKAAAYGVVCIHWFNPLVWLAFVLMESDMEMSCDEAVIKKIGMDSKKEYSLSLLSLSTEKSVFRGNPLAFGEGEVKHRIRNILSYQKRTFLTVVAAGAVLAAVGAGLLLNPAKKNGSQKVSEEEQEKIRALIEAYADACCAREGDVIASLYPDEVTALENEENMLLEKAGDGYSYGFSSPWPNSYRYEIIWEETEADIRYYAYTSDPHVSVWQMRLDYTEDEGEYRIRESAVEFLDSISSVEEFERAYWINEEYQFVDYLQSGFVEAINSQRNEGTSSTDNTVYETPERAAEYILNLSGGEGRVEANYSYQAMVRYRFADGNEVMIPMYDANYDTESQSFAGDPLWIVDTDVWNAGAP